jgi:hypothetical protein
MRGDGSACPATTASGTPIGSRAVRTADTDDSVTDGATYCYSVFALAQDGTESEPATVTATAATPEPAASTSTTTP